MGRPLAGAHDVATPERLLAAAEAEFADLGLRGATLADIARRAGIRRPSLLYHFGSKEALYAAVVERVFGDLGRALADAMARRDEFRPRLRGVVEAFTEFLAARPALGRVVLRELLDGNGPGRAIVVEQVAPLLAVVERFVALEGRGQLRPDLPVRQALMRVVSDVLLRSAAGELRAPLWGDADHTWALTEHTFFAPATQPA
jgi:TetR/AcrR family transcriptional regulator